VIEAKRGTTNNHKARIDAKKVMLCVWWNWNGIVYYELLPPAKTIDSNLHCQWIHWSNRFRKRSQNWSIEKALSSIITTPDRTRFWFGKNWESLAGKFWYIVMILYRQTISFGRTLLTCWYRHVPPGSHLNITSDGV